ncbi:MARVEL domain-containing protein [Lachancea thermotolerans]
MSAVNNYNDNRVAGANGSTGIPANRGGVNNNDYAYRDEGTGVGTSGNTDGAQKEKQKKVMRFAGFVVLDFMLISLRALQFISSVIALGLLAYVLKGYSYHGSHKTNFGLAVAAISVFYLMLLSLLGVLLHKLLLPGLYLLFEIIITILWLCAFVVLAKTHGSRACGLQTTSTYNPNYGSTSSFMSSGGRYDPYTSQYTTDSHMRPCHSAKASIAFAGLCTVLFMISTLIIGLNVIRPIMQRGGGQRAMWTPYHNAGYKLNPWTGLRLSETNRSDLEGTGPHHNDAEGGTGVHDQHTYSTGDSTYNGTNREKLGETDHRRNASGATEMGQDATNTGNAGALPQENVNTTYHRTERIVTDTSPHPITETNRAQQTQGRM